LKYILTAFLLISLIACEEPVTFTEPQPAGTADLSKFPKRLQGNYLSLSDNSILTITDNMIERIYDFDQKFHSNQLDSTTVLSGDTLFNLETKEKLFVKKEGDSLVGHIHYSNILFGISQFGILRKYKGYYFLNTEYGKGWQVQKIQLTKGQLTFSSISSELDIQNLNKLTEAPQDTISPYQFTLTRKDFKKFVRNGGFSEGETFVRQNK
jgi:hypothetical protein